MQKKGQKRHVSRPIPPTRQLSPGGRMTADYTERAPQRKRKRAKLRSSSRESDRIRRERLHKNREAARQSRLRHKEYVRRLEKENRELLLENANLRKRLSDVCGGPVPTGAGCESRGASGDDPMVKREHAAAASSEKSAPKLCTVIRSPIRTSPISGSPVSRQNRSKSLPGPISTMSMPPSAPIVMPMPLLAPLPTALPTQFDACDTAQLFQTSMARPTLGSMLQSHLGGQSLSVPISLSPASISPMSSGSITGSPSSISYIFPPPPPPLAKAASLGSLGSQSPCSLIRAKSVSLGTQYCSPSLLPVIDFSVGVDVSGLYGFKLDSNCAVQDLVVSTSLCVPDQIGDGLSANSSPDSTATDRSSVGSGDSSPDTEIETALTSLLSPSFNQSLYIAQDPTPTPEDISANVKRCGSAMGDGDTSMLVMASC